MVRKKDVDFYCGFSRKELQSLCKKYNLPANRSSSDMAESLASFFEERNGGLKLNEKGPMDPQLENRMKEVDSDDSPSSSSFEFHVSMEEGISLSVDLNFNPSDWVSSMTSEVNVYDSIRRRKSPDSDLGTDNATKCKKHKSLEEDEDGDVRRESSSSPEKKDSTQVASDHHSNGELSLAPSAIEPCKDQNGVDLSIPESSGPGQIVSSCTESCSKSCCVNPVDLECVDPPGKKLSSDAVMVAAEQNHPAGDDLLVETPQNPSMESFQKVGAGSELSSSEAVEAYPSNALCSELIIDREATSYSESFKFRYNGVKNCLPPDGEEQEKSEVFSEQVRLE
uniref:SAP domain-containing protein n=1 Tax=Brassica campestris TaxID=3711 RepID=M4CTA6_BRACM